MEQRIYQVDAFTDKVFGGNPAAVCPLENWLDDALLQRIAAENNLAETAFYVPREGHYEIRWFTPTVEVDLCGHATLAAAFVLFYHEQHQGIEISFISHRSGALSVRKQQEFLTLNFPTDTYAPIALTDELMAGFDQVPTSALKGKTDFVLVYENEEQISSIKPDLSRIAKLQGRGVIVTAPGKDVDFVSRFFAPQSGIDEDPVTGSAHTTLTPFWADKLGRTELTAKQLSARGGFLKCHHIGDRVEISGQAMLYLIGQIFID